MTSLIIPSSSSSILLPPVDHITPETKVELLNAILFWRESKPQTARRTYIADRDIMLIKWLWHTGMRVSDALKVRFDDINNETETVRFIVAKRSRKTPFIHEIILSKAMMFDVLKYRDRWQIVLNAPTAGGRLFPITRQNIDKRLKIYRKIASTPSVSAHKFRHGCAMNMLNQGVPSAEMAFRLAHSSTQVTESVYARMNVGIERKMLEGVEW